MYILDNLPNVGTEIPDIKPAGTQTSALPEITSQSQLDNILASHAQEDPIGLQFYPESCVHTLAVGDTVYVVNEFEGEVVAYPDKGFTYVVPDAYDRACRRMLTRHGITRPAESIQTQRNILEQGEHSSSRQTSAIRTSSLVSAFKDNKEKLQHQGKWAWYEKLRDVQFLSEGPEFSLDKDKFMQLLANTKPEVQTQWSKIITEYPGKVPVHHIPAGQVSGRFSTHAPNLQGLPKVLRPAFYVEPKGINCLITADYKQIQPRILAGLSGDPEWKRPFEKGIDFYKHCASAMFGKSVEDITDDERAVSKCISMGIVFGMGADKMLEELEDRGFTGIDKAKAEELRTAFLSKFATLMAWRDSLPISKYAGWIDGDSAHRTLILPSGRQIVYDATGFAGQPLCSHLAQGIEAEIVVNAILKFRQDMSEKKIDAHVALVLHDELLVSCRYGDAQTVSDMLKDCMEEAYNEYPGMLPAENIVEISAPSTYWPDKSDNDTQE